MTATMQGKTVLVTGGNTGIGKATVVALARLGARVVFTSRDRAKGEAALAEARSQSGSDAIECMNVDLASFRSIRAFAEAFLARYDVLHVLVNNAGIVLGSRRQSEDGLEETFAVNHVGTFLLTELLLDRIKASAPARIVNVASHAHKQARGGITFDDIDRARGYNGFRVYAESKLANIYFTRELARRLAGTGVTVNACHPGVVASDFAANGDYSGPVGWFFKLGRPFLRTVEQGARTSVYLASSPEVEGVTGEYFANEKRSRPTRIAEDDAAAKRLWDLTEQIVSGRRDAARGQESAQPRVS